MSEEKKSKEKKIVFSKEIDSMIDGIALGMSFILLAFLVFFLNIFHNVLADRIISVVLAVIGITGTSFELDKFNRNKVYGLADLVLGLVFTIFSMALILCFDILFLNIILSIVLIFGIFGCFKGLFEILYSVSQLSKTGNKKIGIVKVITFVTELLALAVVIMQLIAEILKIAQ